MNRLIKITGIACLVCLGTAASLDILSPCDSPTVGDHSGAPGETDCSGCHSSPVNPNLPELHFEAGNADSVYTPGNTYLVHLKIKRTGHNKFGFVCSSLDTNNTSKGAFSLINTAITRTYTLGGRGYVSHTPCGADSQDSMDWVFNWTAPATNMGKIKIYMAMLVANHDEDLTGDTTYTRILSLFPPPNIGIKESPPNVVTTVYPIPFHDGINLQFANVYSGTEKRIVLLKAGGETLDSFTSNTDSLFYTIKEALPNGVYFMRISCRNSTQTIKLIK